MYLCFFAFFSNMCNNFFITNNTNIIYSHRYYAVISITKIFDFPDSRLDWLETYYLSLDIVDQNKILTIRYLLLGDTNIPSARFFPIDCTTTVQVQ